MSGPVTHFDGGVQTPRSLECTGLYIHRHFSSLLGNEAAQNKRKREKKKMARTAKEDAKREGERAEAMLITVGKYAMHSRRRAPPPLDGGRLQGPPVPDGPVHS